MVTGKLGRRCFEAEPEVLKAEARRRGIPHSRLAQAMI
jgi:hypothetical protein